LLFDGRCVARNSGQKVAPSIDRKHRGSGGQATRRSSRNEPSPFVDIELHRPFVSHFQQQRLASFLICNIGAFHDLIDLERLLAQCAQDILSIVQHEQTPTVADISNLLCRLIDLSKAISYD
jgi:hypothetical protein